MAVTQAKASNVQYTKPGPVAWLEAEVGLGESAAARELEPAVLPAILDMMLLIVLALSELELPALLLAVVVELAEVASGKVDMLVTVPAGLPPIALTIAVSVAAAEFIESNTDAPMTVEAAPPTPVYGPTVGTADCGAENPPGIVAIVVIGSRHQYSEPQMQSRAAFAFCGESSHESGLSTFLTAAKHNVPKESASEQPLDAQASKDRTFSSRM
ncbi:MAG: hypothetical protein Q9170_003973 [Blastenia crenularia]